MRIPLRIRFATRRAQHLVFLAHVWACTPFLVLWLMDMRIQRILGADAVRGLQPIVWLTLAYLVVRTWLAWRDPPWLRWEYHFPPIDVLIVSAFLFLSHRGPMSGIAMLYFLPIISAAGSLNVRWAAAIGLMVVAGVASSTVFATDIGPPPVYTSTREMLQAEPLNATFRLYFLIVLSSLMAFQSLIAAGLKERLAVAADRNRIALDMHDGVQGHLIALAQQLELLGLIAERNPARAAELAREGRETTRMAADELRFLVQRLRTPALEDGFVPALRQYAHNVCSRSGLELEFEVFGEEETLEPDTENALFRIAQEAMNNVIKHANAGHVWLRLSYDGTSARLEVSDDGAGLSESKTDGVGLDGMRSRAVTVGGAFAIEPRVGGGTTVQATVPTTP